MATRPRKYTSAAPEPVRDAVEEQRKADGKQSELEAVHERAVWRHANIVRAHRAMSASGDPAWDAVADWLRVAERSANAARMSRVETVPPGGEFDHAGRVASAYLRIHGDA